MSLLGRVWCAVTGRDCPPRWRPEDDRVLRETWALADRANAEADAIRERRLTWDRIYGLDAADRREGEGAGGR